MSDRCPLGQKAQPSFALPEDSSNRGPTIKPFFNFCHAVSTGHNQWQAVGQWHSPAISCQYNNNCVLRGDNLPYCSIYIQQVIIVTAGYLWLMVCVSTVHAAFVFIWQSDLLSHAAAEIDASFGWLCVCVCVCKSPKCLPVGNYSCIHLTQRGSEADNAGLLSWETMQPPPGLWY